MIAAFNVYASAGGKASVHIKSASEEWILPPDSPRTVEVEGPLGKTIVKIGNGSVRVISSPCPEKICIKTGPISRPGQWIACLPNRVFITVTGKNNSHLDAFSF